MIRVERFMPEDLEDLAVQPVQRELHGDRRAIAAGLCATGRCFTVKRITTNGIRPIFCGGALATHPGYATMWAAFAHDAGPAMLAIERRTRLFLTKMPERRVDAVVRAGHVAGRRWMGRLGFRAEAVLGAYFEDGEDAVIYRLERAG